LLQPYKHSATIITQLQQQQGRPGIANASLASEMSRRPRPVMSDVGSKSSQNQAMASGI
jgi:hypothetical protein